MMTVINPPAAHATLASRLARRPQRLLSAFVDVVDSGLARFGTGRRWVAVDLDGQDFAFYRTTRGRTIPIGNGTALTERQRRALTGTGDQMELRLGPSKVVTATINVPSGGAEYVPQIVEHRLDRLTPWRTENLLYGFAVTTRADQVDVEFMATSRSVAASAIDRLATYGVAPTKLGSAGEPIDEPLRIDLFRGGCDRSRQLRRARIAVLSLAIPAALAASAAVSTYFASQGKNDVAAIEERIDTARRVLISGTGTASDRQRDLSLISARKPERAVFFLLDQLASILPDTTFLDGLEIGRESIRLQGLSSEASSLIEILGTQPAFAAASFAAPVTRDNDGRDRFDIAISRVVEEATTP